MRRRVKVIREVRRYAEKAMERVGNPKILREGESGDQFPSKGTHYRLYFKKISVNERVVHQEDIKH